MGKRRGDNTAHADNKPLCNSIWSPLIFVSSNITSTIAQPSRKTIKHVRQGGRAVRTHWSPLVFLGGSAMPVMQVAASLMPVGQSHVRRAKHMGIVFSVPDGKCNVFWSTTAKPSQAQPKQVAVWRGSLAPKGQHPKIVRTTAEFFCSIGLQLFSAWSSCVHVCLKLLSFTPLLLLLQEEYALNFKCN